MSANYETNESKKVTWYVFIIAYILIISHVIMFKFYTNRRKSILTSIMNSESICHTIYEVSPKIMIWWFIMISEFIFITTIFYHNVLNQHWTDWNWITTLLPIVELLIAELTSFQTGELHTVIDLNWLELNNDTIVFWSCLTAESELSP